MAESKANKKGTWDPLQMQAALEAVRTGRKVKEVARSFELPESSIRDRLKKGEYYDPRLGRKPTFSQEDEKELAEHVIKLSNSFYGITQLQLRKLAYDFAKSKEIGNIFSEETKMAGKCWVYAFLKRNPEVSLRTPEATSMNRILGFNKTEINIFFSNLEKLMKTNVYPANRIYNVDETGISSVQRPGKIYAPKGQKQVGKITSGERGQNVTVVCAMNASGCSFIPPMFIYPRQRINSSFKTGGPIGAQYECSKSGWINEELFEKWLHHFANNINATNQNPTLLILDNHSSHISHGSYVFCKENEIHMLSLPPHTSHKMQPLDVTFYGPLKSAYHRECDLYMTNHPYEKITHDVLASIFNKAYMKVASMDKAVKGFETTGIFPLNPDIFTDDFISDPHVEDLTCQTAISNDSKTASSTNDSQTNEIEAVAGSSREILNSISPVPQKVYKIKRRTTKQHSRILTSTPLKAELEAKEKKKREKDKENINKGKQIPGKKLAKGKSVKRKVLIDRSSDESSDEKNKKTEKGKQIPEKKFKKGKSAKKQELIYNESDECSEEEDKNKDSVNDVCAFCGEFGRDNEEWFRCCSCSSWIHKECSGKDTAENFICDYCQNIV